MSNTIWAQNDDGMCHRPLSEVEKAMYIPPAAREPIKIHTVVEFTSSRPPARVIAALKEAWIALRLIKSPDIATFVEDGVKYYKVASFDDPGDKSLERKDRGELATWVRATFEEQAPGTTVQDAVKAMQSRTEQLPVLQVLPSTSLSDDGFHGTLILYISHWRTEASGTLMLLSQLLSHTADLLNNSPSSSTLTALHNHKPGDELTLLTPDIETILMPNRPSPPASKPRVETYTAEYKAHLPCIEYPVHPPNPNNPQTASAGPMRILQHTYTAPSTTSLIRACKSANISVTAALHSAYTSTLYTSPSLPPSQKHRSYACMMPADVRKRLSTSSPWREQGCWAAVQMLFLAVPAGLGFRERAERLGRQYGLADDEGWLFEDAREVNGRMLEMFAATSTKVEEEEEEEEEEGKGGTSLPWFTGLGVLDPAYIRRSYGDVVGEKVVQVGKVMSWADSLGPGIVMRCWSFGGRLSVHVAWNGGFHGVEGVREVMVEMERCVEREMGVVMTVEEVEDMVF